MARALAAAAINLPHFLLIPSGQTQTACLCLEPPSAVSAHQLTKVFAAHHGLDPPVFHAQVRVLTLYPVGGGLAIPLAVAACLQQAGLSPLASGTSLSAVTVVLQAEQIALALDSLHASFDVPESASPPDERIRVVQTTEIKQEE